MAVRPKLTTARAGGSGAPPAREAPTAVVGDRDVVVRVYDISTPVLAQTLSLICSKQVQWFPKLTVSVGDRTWSYDGEVERTINEIVENAAGGPPLRVFNLGASMRSDAQIDTLLSDMGHADYNPEEYDFFFRNCNHFCYDLAQRLAPEDCAVDEAFFEEVVLAESESLLVNMPSVQQALTRTVTRQVQKVIIKAWRTEWKRALAEYESEAIGGSASGSA